MRLIATALVAAFALAAAVLLGTGADRPRPAAARALPELPPPDASTAQRLQALRAVVRAVPGRADGWTLLAAAELQRVRETGDPPPTRARRATSAGRCSSRPATRPR